MEAMQQLIEKTTQLLTTAKSVVVFTGAGVSKESGIPTFRDAQEGLWANYDPQTLATSEGFAANPPLVWQWYEWRRQKVRDVEPNAGHLAIAKLADLVPSLSVVTQNVDGLHARAGSKGVLELHGSIARHFCFDKHHQAENIEDGLKEPPLCHCGSMLRPAVVWFGESLPAKVLDDAFRLSKECDLMFVVGTAGVVYPAASLPYIAKDAGAKVVEINPEPTPITDIADVFLPGYSGQVLPQIVTMFEKITGSHP